MGRRFGMMIAKVSFDCFDCRKAIEDGTQIAWDNLRNVRICCSCFDKLTERLGATDGLESDAPKQKKVYWDASMLPIKPWEIGNYDINSWSPELQREYAVLSSSKETYEAGLARAQRRLSGGY